MSYHRFKGPLGNPAVSPCLNTRAAFLSCCRLCILKNGSTNANDRGLAREDVSLMLILTGLVGILFLLENVLDRVPHKSNQTCI